MAAAVGIARFAYTPLLPPLQDALDWTVAQAGDVASANFLGYMVGALIAAMLNQAKQRQICLFAAMLFCVITTAAGGLVNSFPAWLGIRFLSGITSAFCLVLSTAIVIEFLTSHTRSQLSALHFAGVGTGIVISVFAIEAAKLFEFSVFAQWMALAIVLLVLLIVAWLVFRQLPTESIKKTETTAKTETNPTNTSILLRKLIIAYGLFGFGYIITATFIIAMARQLEHATVIEPLTWIVFGLIAAPSVLIWQKLSQSLGTFAALRWAYVIEAIGVLLAGFGTGFISLVIGGALLGGTFIGITALGLIAARQIATNNQAQTIGWMTASFGLGQLLGPAVAGRLAQFTQGFAMPSLMAALMLLIGIFLLWGGDNHRPLPEKKT